jgi:WXG100 family type VII secretion target
MGGVFLGVTAEDLRTASKHCTTTSANVQSEVTQLRSYLAEVATRNRGPAADALQVLSEDWRIAAEKLKVLLEEIARNLIHAANNYEHHESVNYQNIIKVQHNLPTARI